VRALAIVIAATVAISCADPPVQHFPGPDGNTWHSVRCSIQTDCLRRAGEACPSGYVDKYELRNKREMLIRCKGDLGEWKN